MESHMLINCLLKHQVEDIIEARRGGVAATRGGGQSCCWWWKGGIKGRMAEDYRQSEGWSLWEDQKIKANAATPKCKSLFACAVSVLEHGWRRGRKKRVGTLARGGSRDGRKKKDTYQAMTPTSIDFCALSFDSFPCTSPGLSLQKRGQRNRSPEKWSKSKSENEDAGN